MGMGEYNGVGTFDTPSVDSDNGNKYLARLNKCRLIWYGRRRQSPKGRARYHPFNLRASGYLEGEGLGNFGRPSRRRV